VKAVFSVQYLLRLCNENQIPLRERFEAAVRKVDRSGTAAGLQGRGPGSTDASLSEDVTKQSNDVCE
jgi:hypothetical protein